MSGICIASTLSLEIVEVMSVYEPKKGQHDVDQPNTYIVLAINNEGPKERKRKLTWSPYKY